MVTPFIYNQKVYSDRALTYDQLRTVLVEANLSEKEPFIHVIPKMLPKQKTIGFFEKLSFFNLKNPHPGSRALVETLAVVVMGLAGTIFLSFGYFVCIRAFYTAQILTSTLTIAGCLTFSGGMIIGIVGLMQLSAGARFCLNKIKKAWASFPSFQYSIKTEKFERKYTKVQEKQEDFTDLISLETFSKDGAKTPQVIHVEDDVIQSGYLINAVLNMEDILTSKIPHPIYTTRKLDCVEREKVLTQISKIFNCSRNDLYSLWQKAKILDPEQYEDCCKQLETFRLTNVNEVAVLSGYKNEYDICQIQGTYRV